MIRHSLLTLIFFMTSQLHAGFEISPQWSGSYNKELVITCSPEETFCQRLCQNPSTCTQPEEFCLSCIGTSLTMSHLLGELGRTIKASSTEVNSERMIRMLKQKAFATLGPRDVYNVIDASGSVRAIEKFEKLCPFPTEDQVVFLELDPVTRKVFAPSFIHCAAGEGSKNFELSLRPEVIIMRRDI